MKRKHISWKTKCAAAVLCIFRYRNMYDDAKQMTEDQFLSLFNWDHNILHGSEHEDRDKYWNLEPMLIKAHREKTKRDAKVVAKGRRIRAKLGVRLMLDGEDTGVVYRTPKRRIRSRGFDRTRTRKFDGTVVKCET